MQLLRKNSAETVLSTSGTLISMKALVTGSSGFLGKRVTCALAASGFSVTSLDTVSPVNNCFEFLQCDLSDSMQVKNSLSGRYWDVTVHLAGIRGSVEDMKRVNITGTGNLLTALQNNCRRFIMASSCAVYGKPLHPSGMVSEKHTTVPVTDYGRSILEKEKIACELAGRAEMAFTAARLFNLFGPGQPAAMMVASLLEKLIRIKTGRLNPPLKTGPLSTSRDLVDVRDAAAAIAALAAAGTTLPLILNVGNGVPIKGIDVLTALQKTLNTDFPWDEAPGTIGDIECIYSDKRLLAETTGWQPVKSFPETIRDMAVYSAEKSI